MDSKLAQLLNTGLNARGFNVDRLVDITKVPSSTIHLLLGDDVQGILPSRTYLRGHVTVLAKELALDPATVLAALDECFPPPPPKDLVPERRLPTVTIAIAAGLGGIAILAVVIAFASALG